MLKLYQYQEDTISSIDKFKGRALLALDMGLGKTLISLEWIRRHPDCRPVVIICPASLKHVWEAEAYSKTGIRVSVGSGMSPPSIGKGAFDSKPEVLVINYDIAGSWVRYIQSLRPRTVILDECQYITNPTAKRTRAVQVICSGAKNVLALSGTPLMNNASELWTVLNILWPDDYPSYWAFAQKYCYMRYTKWGWDPSKPKNPIGLHKELLSRGMIRYTKADVLKDLPEKVRHVVHCEMIRPDEYKLACDDFLSWLKQTAAHKVRSAERAEKLVRIGYLLRLAAKLKMKSVCEWANAFLANTNEKLVMFAVHERAIDVMSRRINAKYVVIDGSTTSARRKIAVDQFQGDKDTRLFIGNIQAAGVGLTLTESSTVAFAELYWRPGDHIQAEDRIHRIGQKKVSWIYYLVATGTLEERVCMILQNKQQVVKSVLDGLSPDCGLNLYDELINALEGNQ